MTELVTYGSVGGMASNGCLYPESNPFALDHRWPVVPRPSRSLALRHRIASLAAGCVASSRDDWTPPSDAIFASPLAQGTAGNQYRLMAPGDYRPSHSLSLAGSEGRPCTTHRNHDQQHPRFRHWPTIAKSTRAAGDWLCRQLTLIGRRENQPGLPTR